MVARIDTQVIPDVLINASLASASDPFLIICYARELFSFLSLQFCSSCIQFGCYAACGTQQWTAQVRRLQDGDPYHNFGVPVQGA